MGSIVKRTNPSGATVYRAVIRIRKAGYPDFSESRTFSKRALAAAWLKKREGELEANPDLLFEKGKTKQLIPTLAEAITRYLAETVDGYGRSKKLGLRYLKTFTIGKIRLDRLRRHDYADHIRLRRAGIPTQGIAPIAPSTALQELQYIRSVLKYAYLTWGLPVSWHELDLAVMGLRDSRIVASSTERTRLPSRAELLTLTHYFLQRWRDGRRLVRIPMHLIMWLAIYTSRRQDELCCLQLADLDREELTWLVRDVKHPDGSIGNDKLSWLMPDVLPIVDAILDPAIQQRMAQVREQDGYLLGINARSVSAAFTRACKVLGIDDLRFHDLRHEACTRLAEDGLTVAQMQKYTLHESWKTLERYVDLRKRKDRLDFTEAMQYALNNCIK
ncbi:tyrosine-type recombinase/integrase [Conchiformibius steedae]|uniref:tyrosine-type recombinase/integrase n=1 Tax=Conchiformibius steedae TaxID=153493 RepID=UPI0026EA4626|nr:tyrosine-type recombinase/integrase [Conchiformibius steedae]